MPDDPILMTNAQQRLLTMARLRHDDPVFNVPFAVDIDGPLDVVRLRDVLSSIVRRHAPLRSRVRVIEGVPYQVAEPPGPVNLPITEFHGRDEAAEAHAHAFAQAPLDPDAGALFAVELLRLAPDRHRLLGKAHHVIFDGQSLHLMVAELIDGFAGRSSAAGAEDLDYPALMGAIVADDEESAAANLKYWTTQLAGAPVLTELPTVRARPVAGGHRAARRSRELPGELVQPLWRLARTRRVTPFIMAKAVCDVVLLQYGNEHVVIGTAVSERTCAERQSMLGYLVKPVALRSDLRDNPTFTELLAQVRGTVHDAYVCPDLRVDDVLRELDLIRDPSFPPLYQAMIGYKGEVAVHTVGDTRFTLSEFNLDTAITDLNFDFDEVGDGLRVTIEYRADLFEAEAVEHLLDLVAAVFEQVLARPDAAVRDLMVLPDINLAEPAPPSALLADLIAERAQRRPEVVAVRDGNAEWTYGRFAELADQAAAALKDAGAGPEVPVVVCLSPSVLQPATVVGVWNAGGVCVWADPNTPAYLLRALMDEAGAATILVDESTEGLVDHTRITVIRMDRLSAVPAPPRVTNLPSHAAVVVPTPVPVDDPASLVIEHGDLAELADGTTDPAFVGGDIRSLLESVAALAAGVPVTVRRLTDGVLGGRSWPIEALRAGEPADPAISAGRARLLDSWLRPVPPGAVGQVYLSGRWLTRGYWGRPGLTATRLVPDSLAAGGRRMLATGHLARLGADGGLEFHGRIDELPRRHGIRLDPVLVRQVLLGHPGVAQACAGVRAAEGGVTLVAAVVPKVGREISTAELRKYLQGEVAGYLLPDHIAVLPVFPLTTDGRVDLPRTLRGAAGVPDAPPSGTMTTAEEKVAALWRSVLGRTVGRTDNFFDVGGNSMMLLRLREQLQIEFARDVSAVDLFQHPNVQAMAEFFTSRAAVPQVEDGQQRVARRAASIRRRREG